MFIAFPALERAAQVRASAVFGGDPRTQFPWRPMAYVLGVPAGKIGNPVLYFVLVVSGDLLLRHLCMIVRHKSWQLRGTGGRE